MLWFKIFSQLSIGVCIVLSAGAGGVYYLWKYDGGKNIKNEIQNIEQQKKTVSEKIANLELDLKQMQEMDKAMRLMGNEVNKFLQFIPNKVTSAMILNHLNVHAKSAGVDLQNINHHNYVEKKEFYEKLKITVTVKGLFSQILVFLSKLTGLTEIITVDRFTLQTAKRSDKYVGGSGEVIMTMDIYGYRYTSSIISSADNNKKGVAQ